MIQEKFIVNHKKVDINLTKIIDRWANLYYN